jgi:hypothetical protein
VQVLQHDQDRAVVAELGDQVGQVLDEQAALAVPVAPGGGEVPQPGRQQLAEVMPPGVARLPQVAGSSSSSPPEVSVSAGNAAAPTTPNPRRPVASVTAVSRRVLPIPADEHRRLERAMTGHPTPSR